jgi:hypothetical protein
MMPFRFFEAKFFIIEGNGQVASILFPPKQTFPIANPSLLGPSDDPSSELSSVKKY